MYIFFSNLGGHVLSQHKNVILQQHNRLFTAEIPFTREHSCSIIRYKIFKHGHNSYVIKSNSYKLQKNETAKILNLIIKMKFLSRPEA